ncbi:hypothetical protein T01_3576 [Trichinella spiralis]|uniref:Uncharacterized protein n=1 Tax=Trichinella spiralis TaxID=6334 RepID=A0A0V1B7T3_TRISP|nr:hypothetical protein T01_3576 [Trichinella spiralis]
MLADSVHANLHAGYCKVSNALYDSRNDSLFTVILLTTFDYQCKRKSEKNLIWLDSVYNSGNGGSPIKCQPHGAFATDIKKQAKDTNNQASISRR